MKKTLVIHSDDRSTDFLRAIYDGLSGVTLVTGGESRSSLRKMMREHDRVFMLGHGASWGLLSLGKFPGPLTLIDDTFSDLLKEKEGTGSLCIWCYASTFTAEQGLDLIATGMFISEQRECHFLKETVSDDQIDASNAGFCSILAEGIHLPQAALVEKIRVEYGRLAEGNPVAAYNHAQMFGGVLQTMRA